VEGATNICVVFVKRINQRILNGQKRIVDSAQLGQKSIVKWGRKPVSSTLVGQKRIVDGQKRIIDGLTI
jgi:hypothetical protein